MLSDDSLATKSDSRADARAIGNPSNHLGSNPELLGPEGIPALCWSRHIDATLVHRSGRFSTVGPISVHSPWMHLGFLGVP